MRDTTTAIYNKKIYDASIKPDGTVTLISYDKADEQNGFGLYKGMAYIKNVNRTALTDLFKTISKVEYKGHAGNILEDQGNKILIEIDNLLEDEAQAFKMDYATDKGIYAKWVNKSEVKINIEKIKL